MAADSFPSDLQTWHDRAGVLAGIEARQAELDAAVVRLREDTARLWDRLAQLELRVARAEAG